MNRLPSLLIFLQMSIFIGIGGCAYPISYELRAKANQDLTYSIVVRDPIAYKGETVIWGGVITWYRSELNQTILNIMEKPLGYWGVPQGEANSRGRFFARVPRYLSEESLAEGTKVVLAGDIAGEETQPVNGMQARYPVVQVREIHLFRENYYYPYERSDYYNHGYRQGYDEPSPLHGIH